MGECACWSSPGESTMEQIEKAIQADNIAYFRQKSTINMGHDFLYEHTFSYAIQQNKLGIISYLIQSEQWKNIRTQLFSKPSFFMGLLEKTFTHGDAQIFALLRPYMPQDFDITKLRYGFLAKKSVLHLTAEHDNLSCLINLVHPQVFPKNHPCWLDTNGNSPLYYAAQKGHLKVTEFLVLHCKQSPLRKNNAFFSKCPMDVAKGEAKTYLQEWFKRRNVLLAFASCLKHKESPVSILANNKDVLTLIADRVPRK